MKHILTSYNKSNIICKGCCIFRKFKQLKPKIKKFVYLNDYNNFNDLYRLVNQAGVLICTKFLYVSIEYFKTEYIMNMTDNTM
jgi:hypothetical protein